MSFGKNLKECRVEKNISQDELAKKISVHANHISRYERDLSSPSIDVVQRIANALDVSIDELVYGKQNTTDMGLTDRDFIGLFKKTQTLSNKQKQTIKDVLDAFVLTANLKKQLG